MEDEDFLAAVEARVREGLDLAGPPDLRGSTLRSYRALVRPEREREELLAQADREFALVRDRLDRGETERVRAYYASQLPGGAVRAASGASGPGPRPETEGET